MSMIDMAVNGLDTLDKLIPAVRNLGRRHVSYGVKHEHYSSVGGALIWTLEQIDPGNIASRVGTRGG